MACHVLGAVAELSGKAPWLQPLIPTIKRLRADASSVAHALNRAADGLIGDFRFVAQSRLPRGEAYESYIFRTHEIPTRDNMHDLFNGLMWLTYPQTKRRLNEMQAREIERSGIGRIRGPLRDALTLFDENGALLRASQPLIAALRARQWETAFIEMRSEWAHSEVVLFGHALLEKLVQPRKAMTAHVWATESASDEVVSAAFTHGLTTRSFFPLPVLGIPGWCSENDHREFYKDPDVFRPQRAG